MFDLEISFFILYIFISVFFIFSLRLGIRDIKRFFREFIVGNFDLDLESNKLVLLVLR